MFQLLIDNGGDWNIAGDQGSVRQVAEAYSHKDIIDAIPTSGGPKQVTLVTYNSNLTFPVF